MNGKANFEMSIFFVVDLIAVWEALVADMRNSYVPLFVSISFPCLLPKQTPLPENDLQRQSSSTRNALMRKKRLVSRMWWETSANLTTGLLILANQFCFFYSFISIVRLIQMYSTRISSSSVDFPIRFVAHNGPIRWKILSPLVLLFYYYLFHIADKQCAVSWGRTTFALIVSNLMAIEWRKLTI